MSDHPADKPTPRPSLGARFAIDLAPLVVFFATYLFAPVLEELRVIYATGAFMAAMMVAIIFSQVRYKHFSPLLLISGAMVIVFGGITIYLHDQRFIQIKPTIYYVLIAIVLLAGLLTKRNFLKMVLGDVYPGLTDRGWTLLTLNWIGFFMVMAGANEVIRMAWSFEAWAGSKLWLFLPATFVFALLNVPMLMRHGLNLDPATDEPPVPPSQ